MSCHSIGFQFGQVKNVPTKTQFCRTDSFSPITEKQ